MASKYKGHLTTILKIVVAIVLIGYMIHSGHLDPSALWNLMTFPNVALALALVGINVFLAAWRWIILLHARGFYIPLNYGFSLYLIGIFFNHAIPGSVGGDLVRGYYLVMDHSERRLDSILSIAIDRILGLYSFFILTLMAVALDFDFVMAHEKIRWVAISCFLVFMGLTAVFSISFSWRLSHALGVGYLRKRLPAFDRLMEAFQRFGENRKVISLSVLVSLLAQLFAMLFFYILAQVTGEVQVTWNAVMFAVPMGFLVTAVPIAPAGVGVGQVAFLYLFQTYLDRSTAFGTTAITAFQLTLLCWAMVGAVLYLRRRKPKDLDQMVELTGAPIA
jgi:uncharacterized protein (TIRG00374 family)